MHKAIVFSLHLPKRLSHIPVFQFVALHLPVTNYQLITNWAMASFELEEYPEGK